MKSESGQQLCDRCLPLGECQVPGLCPLAEVQAGVRVRIKRLAASEETSQRLREIGLGENQTIRLLTRGANMICQVCNARMGISVQLAEAILVEPVDRLMGRQMA